jgi:hypothetical protein
MDGAGGIAQTAAIVGALTSGAGAVVGWLATYWFGKHREEEVRRWESSRDHLHRQIEELYAPLFGLIQQRRAVYDAASRRLPMQEDGRFDRSKFQGADSKVYNYLVEKYLLPIQARIAGLLQTKIHLLADDDLPTSFANFLEYQSQFEFLHMLWKETGIESSGVRGVHWPEAFEADVGTALNRLRNEYQYFIRALRSGKKNVTNPTRD